MLAGPPRAAVIDAIPAPSPTLPRPATLCCAGHVAPEISQLVSTWKTASAESSDQSLFAGSREEQQVTMNPVNVGNLSAEDKEKMYSAATTEMEYRVELFNK